MSTQSPVETQVTSTESAPVRKTRKKKMSMERVMVIFTLFFGLGILLLSMLPEEGGNPALRGIVMSVYTMASFWLVFRFGV